MNSPDLFRWGVCLLAFALLTNCAENPADKVEKAKVEAVSESAQEPAQTEPETPAEKVTFVFSDSSRIEFVGSKVTGSHSGGFGNFVGKFEIAGDQLSPRGAHTVTIDMASVYSDDEKLTGHLKSEDFFDVATYPTARFQLSKATPLGEDKYELTGTLDLHGVEKEITFPATVKISGGNTIVEFSAEFAINRKDFGIEYPGKPDDLIRDEVVLKFQVKAQPGEPRDLVLGGRPQASAGGAAASTEERPGRPEGARGEGGGQRPDWRNMSPEEREERRRQFMAEVDKNGDGNLGKDEVPERMWQFMSRADKNGDDQITEQERTEYRAERETERMMRELSGEAPEEGRRRGPGGGPGGFSRGDGNGKGKGQKSQQ